MTTPTTSVTGTIEQLPPEDVDAHAVLDDDGNPWRPPEENDGNGGWGEQVRAVFDSATATLRAHPLAAMGVALGAGFIVGRIRAARAGIMSMGEYNPSTGSGSWSIPPATAEASASSATDQTTASRPSSSGASGSSAGDSFSSWLSSALGPTVGGVARELQAAAERLKASGRLDNPWPWIGGAAVVGFILGRTGILRPIAAFTARTALTTLLERTLRTD